LKKIADPKVYCNLKFEFSRKLKPDNAVGLPEIHGFCVGGEKAYGSAIFLRWKLAVGSYSCIPLMVKAFVAPLKKKSIPRLELMGASRLQDYTVRVKKH